jgi:hypothetical protein
MIHFLHRDGIKGNIVFKQAIILPCFLFILLVYLGGCTPGRKRVTEHPRVLKEVWERENLMNIISRNSIKRKDVAFLLVYYLGDLMPFFQETSSLYSPSQTNIKDISGLKEKEYIKECLSIGWMRDFPDGRFYPDDKVKRFHLAIVLFRVANMLPVIDTRTGSYCKIEDVAEDDYVYNVVRFVVLRGFMKLNNGMFYGKKQVTGYETARALSQFRKLLKK